MAIEDTVGGHHGKGIGGALVKGAVITAAAGILGSAALLIYANVSNTSIPELWQNFTSRLHQEEYVPPRPTQQPSQLTTYQKQALEQIALIRQKEPGLAELLPQTGWFSNGVDQTEAEFVAKIGKYVADGNYVLDKITHNDGSVTNLLVLSADKDERDEALVKTQQYLPAISQLLRIEYKKPLLIVEMDIQSKEIGGGNSSLGVSVATSAAITHELVHEVYKDSEPAYPPPWFTEGKADFIWRYIEGGNALVEGAYEAVQRRISEGDINEEPLSHAIFIKPDGKINQDVYHLGFRFLVEFEKLVEPANFWDALLSVYNAKVERGVTGNNNISNKDLEDILKKHVPSDKQPAFKQLYQQRVYGLPETQP